MAAVKEESGDGRAYRCGCGFIFLTLLLGKAGCSLVLSANQFTLDRIAEGTCLYAFALDTRPDARHGWILQPKALQIDETVLVRTATFCPLDAASPGDAAEACEQVPETLGSFFVREDLIGDFRAAEADALGQLNKKSDKARRYPRLKSNMIGEISRTVNTAKARLAAEQAAQKKIENMMRAKGTPAPSCYRFKDHVAPVFATRESIEAKFVSPSVGYEGGLLMIICAACCAMIAWKCCARFEASVKGKYD